MPTLNWRLSRKKKTPPLVPQPPPANLGSPQPSSSTVESWSTLSSPNSHVGQGSNGVPQRKPLPLVREHPDSYYRPAELEAHRRDASWTAIARIQQPHFIQQDIEQQQRLAEEAQLTRALHDSEDAARRREQADAERRMLEKERNASAETVRKLRELIRERYALDLYIWEKRNVQRANRKKIEPKCRKADRILQEIYFIVNSWDSSLFDKEEWDMVKKIKAGLATKQLENGDSNEPAIWGDLPPWDRRDQDQAMASRQVF